MFDDRGMQIYKYFSS